MINEILNYNKAFVARGDFEVYRTSKYPNKKLAIVTCMDTRLIELLPAALGIKNGDAKIIKNAGGVISHPFGSAVRSLLIAIYELGVTDVMVIGHTDCGVQHMDGEKMLRDMRARGVSDERIRLVRYFGVNPAQWLAGFNDVAQAVSSSVELLRNHPLIPADVRLYGFVMDSVTGELVAVESSNNAPEKEIQ